MGPCASPPPAQQEASLAWPPEAGGGKVALQGTGPPCVSPSPSRKGMSLRPAGRLSSAPSAGRAPGPQALSPSKFQGTQASGNWAPESPRAESRCVVLAGMSLRPWWGSAPECHPQRSLAPGGLHESREPTRGSGGCGVRRPPREPPLTDGRGACTGRKHQPRPSHLSATSEPGGGAEAGCQEGSSSILIKRL